MQKSIVLSYKTQKPETRKKIAFPPLDGTFLDQTVWRAGKREVSEKRTQKPERRQRDTHCFWQKEEYIQIMEQGTEKPKLIFLVHVAPMIQQR